MKRALKPSFSIALLVSCFLSTAPVGADSEGRVGAMAGNVKWLEASPHFNKGIAHLNAGAYDKAIAEFNTAIEIYPTDSEFHNNLGLTYKKKGDMARAETCLRESIRLDPHSWDSWSNLGSVLKHQGRPQEAVDAYRNALKFKPPAKAQGLLKQNIAALGGRGTEVAPAQAQPAGHASEPGIIAPAPSADGAARPTPAPVSAPKPTASPAPAPMTMPVPVTK